MGVGDRVSFHSPVQPRSETKSIKGLKTALTGEKYSYVRETKSPLLPPGAGTETTNAGVLGGGGVAALVSGARLR